MTHSRAPCAPAYGVLHESFVHVRYIWLKKFGRSRAPRTRRCENACQRARRYQLMAATAVWASWVRVTAEHVGSMARPTTDDNITVYDDAVFCDSETQKTSVRPSQALPVLGMLGRGTQ